MLNFPSSPINGQEYDNWVYNTAKGAWLAKPLEPMAAVPSPVAPATPQPGDMWFNTNEATTYVYYDDGNTSQWVEMVAQTGLTSPLAVTQGGTGATTVEAAQDSLGVGLVRMIPTAVRISGGTATANNLGRVSFTNATSIALDNAFTTQYKRYQIIVSITDWTINNAVANVRMTSSGTPTTANQWYYGGLYWGVNGNGFSTYASASADYWLASFGTGINTKEVISNIDLSFQNSTLKGPHLTSLSDDLSSGYGGLLRTGRYNEVTTAFDGIRIAPSSGSFTGSIQVFAYNT